MLEKETRLRESLKMMGLSGWILWLTWYLKQFLFLMITIILMTILIKVKHAYIRMYADMCHVLCMLAGSSF